MPRYHLGWARSVVKSHYQQYARAAYLLTVSTHITLETVARWLASSKDSAFHAQLWQFYKLLVERLSAQLERRLAPDAKHVFSKLTRSILSEVWWEIYENCPDGLLTARDWWVEHEEQFFKARPRRARSGKETGQSPDSLPLFQED